MDEVLSMTPSVNVFVFGDFNVLQKEWLTYSGGTDIYGEPLGNSDHVVDFPSIHNRMPRFNA